MPKYKTVAGIGKLQAGGFLMLTQRSYDGLYCDKHPVNFHAKTREEKNARRENAKELAVF
jgi:hypothetical protein